MNPQFVTYIGFVVALAILCWGGIELFRRQYRRKTIDRKTMDAWVHLKPGAVDRHDGSDKAAGASDQHLQTKAKQNGHYSESQRKL